MGYPELDMEQLYLMERDTMEANPGLDQTTLPRSITSMCPSR